MNVIVALINATLNFVLSIFNLLFGWLPFF